MYKAMESNMIRTKNLRFLLLTPYLKTRTIRDVIANALEELGFKSISLADFTTEFGRPISESVQKAIESADIIIADLTGSSPSVMYEVGFAHAMRKPVLFIVENKEDQVPFDLVGYLYLVYDTSNLNELRRKIQNWAVRYTNEQKQGDVKN